MIFSRSARKRSRLGSGVYRPIPSQGPGAAGQNRQWQMLAIGASFFIITLSLTHEFLPTENTDYGIEGVPANAQQYPIAREDVKVDISFQSEDLKATAAEREKAALMVPDVYRVDEAVVQKQLQQLDARVQDLLKRRSEVDQAVRKALLDSDSGQDTQEVVAQAVTGLATSLASQEKFKDMGGPEAIAPWLMPDPQSVPKRIFKQAAADSASSDTPQPVESLQDTRPEGIQLAYADLLGEAAHKALEFVLNYGVLPPDVRASKSSLGVERLQNEKILVQRAGSTSGEAIPLIQVPAPKEATDLLEARSADTVASTVKPGGPVDTTALQQAAFAVAKGYLTDTLRIDAVATDGARESARAKVEPVMHSVRQGTMIQEAGVEWTAQSIADLRAYLVEKQRRQGSATNLFPSFVASMLFAGLGLACLIRGIDILGPVHRQNARALYVVLLILCATLVLSRIVWYFGDLGYIVPVTAAVLLLAILVNVRMATLAAVVISLLMSIQYDYDWQLLVVSCAMSVGGAFSIFIVRRRTDMTRAAIKATGIGLLATAAIMLATEAVDTDQAWHRLLLVSLNGAACLFIVPGLLPPLERLFGITTDIQLLEYSDLNNELLSRMAIEVPATYAHSLMLGQLAEAAADAIGANGLLARVCAYYHDIGKLRRPEYFSENQTNGNIHDTLTPRLSARAIAAHVIQGAEMAREAHLPQPIVDGILEHHGTSLISFFYQQAQAQCKHGDIREEDFRYPGPKPQSRETAILMICDAVESGVRSIKNPNEERVREFVDKIVSARAADRQFDESDLTLKDLDVISEVVAKRILSSLHTRIAYPDTEEKKAPATVVPISAAKE